jgi:hypothetical protein
MVVEPRRVTPLCIALLLVTCATYVAPAVTCARPLKGATSDVVGTKSDRILLTDGPAVVTIEKQGFGRTAAFVCEPLLLLSTMGHGEDVELTSSGLGKALIAFGAQTTCDRPPESAEEVLRARASTKGTLLTVYIPTAIGIDNVTFDATIVAFNATARSDCAVKIRTEDGWPIKFQRWLIVTLIAGISIPTLFTFALGYRGYLIQQEWSNQKSARKAFDDANAAKDVATALSTLFTTYLTELNKLKPRDDLKWGEALWHQLLLRDQFLNMPEPERRKLIQALKTGKRQRDSVRRAV